MFVQASWTSNKSKLTAAGNLTSMHLKRMPFPWFGDGPAHATVPSRPTWLPRGQHPVRQGQSTVQTPGHHVVSLSPVSWPLCSHRQNGKNSGCPSDLALCMGTALWGQGPCLCVPHRAPSSVLGACLALCSVNTHQGYMRNDETYIIQIFRMTTATMYGNGTAGQE